MFIADFSLKTTVQKILCQLLEIIDFPAVHPKREMQRRAMMDTCDYITEKAINTLVLDTARDVLDRALLTARPLSGLYAEFGVFKGATINYIAKKCSDRTIWGFDSFQGLGEDWSGNASMFDAAGKLPSVKRNVRLVSGWFNESLPGWLEEHREPIAFMHIDCDIYSSTKTIFDGVVSRLQPGAIIVFDEYFGYPGWRNHEFKAFQEMVTAHRIEYRYLCFARIQAAIKIVNNPSFRPPA
jgi:hypothetical protein